MAKNGTNYTANDDEKPTEVTFENGRRVKICCVPGGTPYLEVDTVEKEKPMNRKEATKAAILHLNSYAAGGDELLKSQIADVIKGLSRTRKAKAKAPAAETPAAA